MKNINFTSVLISLPIQVAADLDLTLFDPVRGKIKYGARSRLVSALLARWLRDRQHKSSLDQLIEKGNVDE